jgi:hypothetical protein
VIGDFHKIFLVLLEERKQELFLERVFDGILGKLFVVSNHIDKRLLNAFIGIVGYFLDNGSRRRWRGRWGRWAKDNI